MRLIVRFGFFALLLGALVGAALRVIAGRRAFALLAALAALPLALHAGYLLLLAGRAGLPSLPVIVFAVGAGALTLASALLGRGWAVTRPWWAVALPTVAAIVYFVFATLALTGAWERHEYSPDAVVGAAYGIAALFASGLLLPFAPRAGADSSRSGRSHGL